MMYDPHLFADNNCENISLKISKLGEVWGESGNDELSIYRIIVFN